MFSIKGRPVLYADLPIEDPAFEHMADLETYTENGKGYVPAKWLSTINRCCASVSLKKTVVKQTRFEDEYSEEEKEEEIV